MRTASNKKHEQIRFASRCRCIDIDRHHPETAIQPQDESELGSRVDGALQNSAIWKSLSADQRYAIVLCVMLDCSPAAVAVELGLKRQTVASRATRIPKRLAREQAFQQLKKQLEVNDGQ